jgi:hypothetical protein
MEKIVMFKKYIFIILICIYQIVYADMPANNSVGNVGSVGNLSFQNLKGSPSKELLDVKYAVYNYQMNQAEFAKFLEINNLHKSANLVSSKNIVSFTVVQKEEFDALNQKLAKEFSNKFSGGSRCIVNNDLCAGGSSTGITTNPKDGKQLTVDKKSIQFKVFTDKTKLSTKVISDDIVNNQVNAEGSVSIKSEAVLKDIKNKNYVLISQISKNGTLYGQIVQISFTSPN